jgi:DNA polymerase-4
MSPVILHIDMNSYFASVEQQDNVAWRGKPVGVCEHLGGIIIAASVEAKQWGIKTGTPVWEARKLYPKIILTKTHADRYRMYTARLIKILSDYTEHVEQYSIDEAFLDVTKVCNISLSAYQKINMAPDQLSPFVEAARIASEIKIRMKTEVGDWLRCSVGIAENKLLAKIASDLQKPDGVVVIVNQNTNKGTPCALLSPGKSVLSPLWLTKNDLYSKLVLTDIPGIGHRQEKRLNELGIKTLAHLRDYPRSKLIAQFGIGGHHLYEMGQLESSWKPKVEQDGEIKSIGHMYTLPQEFREKKFFVPVLYKLSEMVARRMRVQKLNGNILHFHIHDGSHECYGKSKKLGYRISDGREIFFESMKIFDTVIGSGSKPPPAGGFKLIGVTIAGLSESVNQLSLFDRDERSKRVVLSLDTINEKYGDFTVCRVPVRLAGNAFRDSIGFGRIKEHFKIGGDIK